MATGHFVHVFVDRQTRKPTAMPPMIRACLERLA
jgi:acyl-CoA thioesterase FadM